MSLSTIDVIHSLQVFQLRGQRGMNASLKIESIIAAQTVHSKRCQTDHDNA
jgi:hypothetical protein